MQAQPIVKRSIFLFLALSLIHFFGSGQNADTPYRMKTVVIDAGHGGKDPGNLGTGRYKAKEKDIALDVALRVGGYIEKQFPEIKVIYTRSTDIFIGLDERAEIANKAKADLFLSIHCNAFPNPESNGVETFVLGLHRNKENLQVAMKENSAIFLEEDYKTKYEGFDPNSAESIIALTIMQSAYLQQSLTISSYIQEQFKNRVGRKDRGVKQAGFLVLRKTTMPSILIELGFLTNAAEEDFLNSENGKAYMSSAIFRGFKDYKDMVEDPLPEGYVAPVSESENVTPLKADEEKKKKEEALAAEKAKEEAKKKELEKARQDSIQKVLDQAKLKAVADSLERKKQQLLDEKKKREEELKKKEEVAKQERLKAVSDSLEQVKLDKLEELKRKEKAIEEAKAKALAEVKAKEEADRLAKEEAARKELEAKEEAKKWLEEIKEVKERELEEAKRQATVDAEKERLEAIKQQKLAELEEAKRKEEERLSKEKSDSLSVLRMIKEQVRIDSLSKVESARSAEQENDSLEAVRLAEKAKSEKAEQERLAVERRQKAVADSLQQVAVKQEQVRIAKEKAAQDSIAAVRKAEAEAKAVTIDNQKAATPEEAELLFLQLRKKQLEQRIAQLRGQNIQSATQESLERSVQETVVSKHVPEGQKETGVVLKVQVVTSAKALSLDDRQFKGQNVWQYQQDGLYKYTVGATDDFEEITKLQGELRNLGFKGAFVVAFNNGERIKVSEARELLNKTE